MMQLQAANSLRTNLQIGTAHTTTREGCASCPPLGHNSMKDVKAFSLRRTEAKQGSDKLRRIVRVFLLKVGKTIKFRRGLLFFVLGPRLSREQ
jgi:hypothetical protein